MKKRLLSLFLAVCLILTAAPFAFAAEMPSSFDVYLAMNKLRAEYPEGTPWTNDDIYQWNGGIFTHGAGCAGFAFILSDAAFGNLPARKLTGVSADDLRPGDILRLNGDTHSVIVLQNTYYGIVVAEGNYNASVHWDRVISRADAESADYVLTRYPEDWADSAPAKPILESAQITNQLNWMERSYPQGMHWGYHYSYNWQGGILNGSAGSYAFAMLLSDTVFSNLPATIRQGVTLSEVRVGDIVVDKDGGAGIVVEKLGDRIRLAEGQDGGIVNWQKTMNESDMALSLMTITRYPDSQAADGEKTLEQQAQDAMNAMREQYPEGKKWGSGDSYSWNGRPNETGYGCVGFAYILSDGAFGDLPAREVTDVDFDDVRAGDILKINGYTVIVLETYDDAVMIAEGEYNGGIHWGRYLSRNEVESAESMLTRYPEDYEDPDQSVVIYQPSGNVIQQGTCGYKGAPVYWKLTDEGTLLIYGSGATDNYNFIMNYNLPPWNDYRGSITRVVIQEGVYRLGTQTLAYLYNLTNVTLPTTLEKIDTDCFVGCSSLETIRLPEGLRELGNRVFQGLTMLKYVNFPTSLTRIGDNCFEKTGLAAAELKEGIYTLGSNAFSGCANLTTAVLPGSLGSDGPQYVFTDCTKLSLLTLGEGITKLGRSFAEGCTSLREVVFPSTLTHIFENAFDTTGIQELTLPAGLEVLGNWAFSGCDRLETVNILCDVAEFGNNVFTACDALKNVNIAEGVTNFGRSTFSNCPALEYVKIPGSVERVGVYAFNTNVGGGVKVLVVEEGVQVIEKFAFQSCDDLKEIHLPASLVEIGENAFDNDEYMKDVTVFYSGTPEQWAQIAIGSGNYSFDGAMFVYGSQWQCGHALTDVLPAVEPNCTQTGLTEGQICQLCGEVVVPQETLPVLEHSFDKGACIWCGLEDPRPSDMIIATGQCGNDIYWYLTLDGTLTLDGWGPMWNYTTKGEMLGMENLENVVRVIVGPGITSIGKFAFWGCVNMTEITLGDEVELIGESSFTACASLKSILLPENVTKIARVAFNNCTGLETVEFRNGNVYLDSWAFTGCESLTTVIIPQGDITMHKNNPFQGTAFLAAGMDEQGFNILDEYLLYYGGTNSEPVIPNTVIYISSEAFMNNTVIEKILIPESVEEIGDMAFLYCPSLREVVIAGNVKTIGKYAFRNNESLEKITFRGDAPSINEEAFGRTDAEAYYPVTNPTWTVNMLKGYGGQLYWYPYDPSYCSHDNKMVIIGYAATCTKPGLSNEISCSDCGKILELANTIQALGHDWNGDVCTRCGEQKPVGILGDVDGNGKLTYNDALMILRYSIKLSTLENPELADMDGNGRVDYNDALKVLRVSIGLN